MAVSEDSTEVIINDQQSVDKFSLATGISHKPGLELQPLNIYSTSESSKNRIELLTQPAIMQSSGENRYALIIIVKEMKIIISTIIMIIL